jgi:hypothetical protein
MRNTKKDSQPYTGASTTSVPTCAAQVRVITMSARTSWRCCNTSRVSRISQHLTLTADPGETSKSLPKLGHIAGRVEGAAHSADRAPAYSGCEVLVAGILKLDLPDNYFDGVFADAALFQPGVAAHVVGPARKSETGWCAVQLKSARSLRGRLERWALRRLL